MLEELEEREREFKKSKLEKQKQQAAQLQETEKIKDEGRRMREERQKQMEREAEEQKEKQRQAEQELEPPALGMFLQGSQAGEADLLHVEPTDTTVRIKWTVSDHPELTTPKDIASLFYSFGEVDTDSIVVSLKPPKKAPQKPPKHGTALIPFKKIGDAFATVCASGLPERGMKNIEIGWIGGKEPQILGWLQKMGKLGPNIPSSAGQPSAYATGEKASLPQTQVREDASTFSSFPASFVSGSIVVCLPSCADSSPAGLFYCASGHSTSCCRT